LPVVKPAVIRLWGTQAAFDVGVKAKKERVGFERINE